MLGVPVLAAEAGALPEICGKGALLVPPDDAEAVTDALERVLFDDPAAPSLPGRPQERPPLLLGRHRQAGQTDLRF
jgi:glycosyltransferase involved in cell wall biosynthesis